MYGFSVMDAMIKPKKREENSSEASIDSACLRKIANQANSNGDTYKRSAKRDCGNHRKQNPRWVHYSGDRYRHEDVGSDFSARLSRRERRND